MYDGTLAIAAAAVELAECCVPQVVPEEPARWVERLEQRQAGVRPVPLGDGDRAIQRMDGRRREGIESLIQARDLLPSRLPVGRCQTVLGSNRCFGVISRETLSPRRSAQVRDSDPDQLAIPEGAILFLQDEQAARAIDTRVEARGVQVHERD